MNTVSVIGTLADEPELRTGDGGVEECWMRIAVPRYSRGQREPGVVYVDAATRGLQASEHAARLSIGKRVGVSGRLEQEDYAQPDGTRVTEYAVLVDRLDLLDPADEDEGT